MSSAIDDSSRPDFFRRGPRIEPLLATRSDFPRRLFDGAVGALGLLITSPLFALAAIAIKLDSRGPVFFRQQRVGRDFRPFLMWKFRTMAEDASSRGPSLTVGDDPRVTRIGGILRRFKIDELPQLINVVTGDMSLVGPRPELQHYVDLFVTDYRELLQVRPGITDLASIAFRDEAAVLARADDPEREYLTHTLPRKIALAREGIERSSWWFDLLIILATVLGRDRPVEGWGTQLHPAAARAVTVALTYRRLLVITLHVTLAAVSNYVAYWLRFDGNIPKADWQVFVQTIGWLLVVRLTAFAVFRANQGLWRYASLWHLRCIVMSVAFSTVAWYLLVHGVWRLYAYPRSVFLIDAMLLVCLMSSARLARRIYAEVLLPRHGKRVLIVGEGDMAEMIVRDMEWHAHDRYVPIGLLDSDPRRLGESIHGVPVLGCWTDLPRVMSAARPHEVLVAVSNHDPVAMRGLLAMLEPFRVAITIVPRREGAAAHVSVGQIRRVSVEDLLERAPVGLDPGPLNALLAGRRVLVTGAGGSIGSELCLQIASRSPSALILYERYENNLYSVVNALEDRGLSSGLHPVVGDVTDAGRLEGVFARYRPDVVFHAAAHKHVPLMEANPCEAVKNNVIGTRMVAEVSARYGADRMILISSDKAVNPTSIMGATKRIAELVHAQLGTSSTTKFATVRFGNVLGSNGSVVPRFLDQIAAGGPVTVTHPEVRRFFMLISEAVELVLHAAAMAETGTIYLLEMGHQVPLVDLARSLIRLAGHIPDEEIRVVFTGLRPGEKLSEELVNAEEDIVASSVPRVMRLRSRDQVVGLRARILELEHLALTGDEAGVVAGMRALVPTFTPRAGMGRLAAVPREPLVLGLPVGPAGGTAFGRLAPDDTVAMQRP